MLELDLRNYLVAANTPAGNWVYFTTAPQDSTNQFITINLLSDDAQHTTQTGGGHLTFATVEVTCSVKGTDQFDQYIKANTLADSVKTAINSITTWPYVMGNTTVYYIAIETIPEQAKSRGTYSLPYQYQEGKGTGIQRKVVPLFFSYWNPNN